MLNCMKIFNIMFCLIMLVLCVMKAEYWTATGFFAMCLIVTFLAILKMKPAKRIYFGRFVILL